MVPLLMSDIIIKNSSGPRTVCVGLLECLLCMEGVVEDHVLEC